MDLQAGLIADAMLGGLARWLRAAGLDVEYEAGSQDEDLAAQVASTGRILLTRDRRLACRRLVRGRVLLLEAQDLVGQIQEIHQAFGPLPLSPLSRCTVCNGLLSPCRPEDAAGKVPAFVLAGGGPFLACGGCGRVYWPGTHRERLLRRLVGLGLIPAASLTIRPTSEEDS